MSDGSRLYWAILADMFEVLTDYYSYNYLFFSSRKEILRDLQQPQKNTDVGPENGQETKFTQN